MKIAVQVKPGKKENRVEQVSSNAFIVHTTEQAKEGRANEAVVKLLANYLTIAPSSVHIVAGFKSKMKIVEVPTES